MLHRYASIDEMKPQENALIVDGAARYIGESFRRVLGGRWFIDSSDGDNAYHGLPQLGGCRNQTSQICPLKMVTAAVGRRTGNFSRTILENHL